MADSRAELERAHLIFLENDPSFAWFMDQVQVKSEKAVQRALSQAPAENREYLIGRSQGIGDVVALREKLREKLRNELEGTQ